MSTWNNGRIPIFKAIFGNPRHNCEGCAACGLFNGRKACIFGEAASTWEIWQLEADNSKAWEDIVSKPFSDAILESHLKHIKGKCPRGYQ